MVETGVYGEYARMSLRVSVRQSFKEIINKSPVAEEEDALTI